MRKVRPCAACASYFPPAVDSVVHVRDRPRFGIDEHWSTIDAVIFRAFAFHIGIVVFVRVVR